MAKKRGRPSKYSEKLVDEICKRIASGRSLVSICDNDDDVPSSTTVNRWLTESDKGYFRENYARATSDRADKMFEEILAIADDGSNDWTTTADGRPIVDHEHVNRSRLRVDARKWMLGKMQPKKYGDKVALGLADDDDKEIEVTITIAGKDEAE